MTTKGYLYMLYNKAYDIFDNHIIKIGSSKNPIGRLYNYITSFPTECKFIKVVEITGGKYTCYQSDTLLKRNSINKKYPYEKIQWIYDRRNRIL
jgi:hypothetical protein